MAENKKIIIQSMRERASDSHPQSFIPQNTNNQTHQPAHVQAGEALCPKQEQLSELKLKSMLGSQLTQENSDISYAFKAHVLIMTFERLKSRRMCKAFTAVRGRVLAMPQQLPANTQGSAYAQTSNNQPKRSQQLSDCKTVSLQFKVREELPAIALLQQLHLNTSHKFLTRQLFQSKLQVGSLSKRVRDLEADLAEAMRRQEREAMKKRQSLQSLVEQLGQKNELIEELKGIVRTMKAKMNVKHSSSLILEEDCESLRKQLLHMESVNDRLNADLTRLRQHQTALLHQVKLLSAENEKLKCEISKLREEGFEVDAAKEQAEMTKRECSIQQRRLRSKEERLIVLEKRVNELARKKGAAQFITFSSQKRMEQAIAAQPSQREVELCTKLECVIEFFFHIEDSTYQLHSASLFDEEEMEFLQSQKLKITAILQERCKSHYVSPLKSKKIEEDSETVNDFGCTILHLIESESKRPSHSALQSTHKQEELFRLRQRIGELKDRQLFVRAVLLSFLKSLELQSLKKQSQNIIQLLYDCFEYSEEERASIFHSKPRKIFGFI